MRACVCVATLGYQTAVSSCLLCPHSKMNSVCIAISAALRTATLHKTTVGCQSRSKRCTSKQRGAQVRFRSSPIEILIAERTPAVTLHQMGFSLGKDSAHASDPIICAVRRLTARCPDCSPRGVAYCAQTLRETRKVARSPHVLITVTRKHKGGPGYFGPFCSLTT